MLLSPTGAAVIPKIRCIMTTRNQTSNPSSLGRFGDLLFARQTPMLHAETHRGRLSGRAADFQARLQAWRERRKAAAELSRLSDRELEDIGLTRQQIPDIVSAKR